MRVLLVTPAPPYLPTYDRTRQVAAHLLAHLARRHSLAVVTRDTPGPTPAQRGWAATVGVRTTWQAPARRRALLSPGHGLAALAATVRRAVAEWTPDLVHLDGLTLAPLAASLSVPVVLGGHASQVRRAREVQRLARTPHGWMRAQLDERQAAEWERRWLPAASACIVGSELDRTTLAERVPFDRIEMIPPGVDEASYGVRRGPRPGRLVFAGDLAWPAHAAAAHRLAERVLPLVRRTLPQTELLVAGAGPRGVLRSLAAVPGVQVAGAVPDLRPTFWRAAVTLVPDEAAPGVDAAILESMALGTPVVAAPRCLAGLDHVLPGRHVLVADDDAAMSASAILVLREPLVAATLAASARALVERRYTWAAVARAHEALWTRAAGARPTAVAA